MRGRVQLAEKRFIARSRCIEIKLTVISNMLANGKFILVLNGFGVHI